MKLATNRATTTPTTAATATDAESVHFCEPYERLRAEFDSVDTRDLIIMNFDVPLAVTTVLGALPALATLRPRIAHELPAFDHARFDRLEDYARAAAFAHARYLIAATPRETAARLNAQAVKTRDSLLIAATALADRGAIPAGQLAGVHTGQGYRDTCTDLIALAAIFRDVWDTVRHRTAVEAVELDQAELLAEQLLVAVGRRDQADPAVVAAAEARRRALTVFAKVYDQARRAVAYLRWSEGDADAIAPSIYIRSAPASRKRDAAAAAAPSSTSTVPAPNASPESAPQPSDPSSTH